MSQYLDPRNDLVFKKVFGKNQHLLLNFLNALMPLEPGQKIEEVHYLSPEQVPDNPEKKNSIVDVKCTDNQKRTFIVEMQMYWKEMFKKRLIFNTAKAYVNQIKKKERYNLLQPVYALAIVNDVYDKKTTEFYHHYKIININNTDEVLLGMEYVLIELPKFRPQAWADKKMAVLWLRFLNDIEEFETPTDFVDDEYISEALEICKVGNFTDAELARYEANLDAIRIEMGVFEEGIEKGMEKGIEKGKVLGIEEGLEKGKVLGIEEGMEIAAINMINKGFTDIQIMGVTNLSLEKIMELRGNTVVLPSLRTTLSVL